MKEKILELRRQGKTYREIQNILGCSRGTISYHIGPGQREKTLQRNKTKSDKKRRYLTDLKNNTPCMDCGESYPYFMMDLDHREDEEKRFNVSQISQFSSMEQLIIEVQKCDVVCSNCHRMRTWLRERLERMLYKSIMV